MFFLGAIGFSFLMLVAFIYGLYFIRVLKNKRSIASFIGSINAVQGNFGDEKLENVSIIVNTFNESSVIERKIRNLSKLNYPKEKLEVIVYDDSSTDGTSLIAKQVLKDEKLQNTVIQGTKRLGLNRSLNKAVQKASYDYVCITDSDVILHADALRNAVLVLKTFENTGGVTGRILPVFEGKGGVAHTSESSYRDFYHDSMLAESSVHSAFPGNGPLIVFDKRRVPCVIPQDYGSTDGNIAVNVVKQGLRFIYVPNAIVYEPSPENLKQHRIQKLRRAKRLLQVIIKNSDIALNKKYSSFGRLIFPLKLAMLALCPLLLFIGLSLVTAYVLLSQDFILLTISAMLLVALTVSSIAIKRIGNLVSSFILHQFYLLIGLLASFSKSVYWKTIDRSTKLNFD